MNLDGILGLPKSGVVVLQKQNQVLVSYTTSMGANLESLYNSFRGHTGITLKVFSPNVDLETLKLHTEYYRDLYIKKGFILLQSNYRKTICYKVRIVPSLEFKMMDVELVNTRGDSKFVGRFRTNKQALEFIDSYYKGCNPMCFPVYALNCDTKQFLGEQTKILDIR